MPAVCRTEHPVHHSDRSLLCHCLHSALVTHELDSSEQKNFMGLLASLIQVEEWKSFLFFLTYGDADATTAELSTKLLTKLSDYCFRFNI